MEGLREFDGTADSLATTKHIDLKKRNVIMNSALLEGKEFTFADVMDVSEFDEEFFQECSIKAFERAMKKRS